MIRATNSPGCRLTQSWNDAIVSIISTTTARRRPVPCPSCPLVAGKETLAASKDLDDVASICTELPDWFMKEVTVVRNSMPAV